MTSTATTAAPDAGATSENEWRRWRHDPGRARRLRRCRRVRRVGRPGGSLTGLLWSVARGFRLDQADAGDAVQTAWLRLVEHLDRLHDPDHVGAWLATTVRRECLRQLRRSGGRERPTETAIFGTPSISLQSRSNRPAAGGILRGTQRCPRTGWPSRAAVAAGLMADPPPSYEEVGSRAGHARRQHRADPRAMSTTIAERIVATWYQRRGFAL